jgi:hypothetical protein
MNRLKAFVDELGYIGDDLAVSLVQLCRQLQKFHGSNPFFLSYAKAAEIFSTESKAVHPMIVYRKIQMLVADGILETVSIGSLATGEANEYRYLPKD